MIHETAIVEAGAEIGEGTNIWHHAHVRSGSRIGSGCNIGKNCYIDAGVTIGSGVKIQNNVSVYHGVEIGDDVFVGPSAVFTNDYYPRAFNPDWEVSETRIGKGASLGANCTIVCGHQVGLLALISFAGLNEPVRIQYSGNVQRIARMMITAEEKIRYPVDLVFILFLL